VGLVNPFRSCPGLQVWLLFAIYFNFFQNKEKTKRKRKRPLTRRQQQDDEMDFEKENGEILSYAPQCSKLRCLQQVNRWADRFSIS
jgi:hypothetical protein